YNLAVATIPAFVFCLVFGIVFNLTRSYLGGLIGAFLTVFAGTLKSVIQMASLLPNGPQDPKIFRERYEATGLYDYFVAVWEQIKLTLLRVPLLAQPDLGESLTGMAVCLESGRDGASRSAKTRQLLRLRQILLETLPRHQKFGRQ
ncbi:MAG: hypothetical protein KC978_10450, partial [Candidatus Omnitrophica bacterium]|nr:hypothetical protein [Candidatus Omnitrophota bacterium]